LVYRFGPKAAEPPRNSKMTRCAQQGSISV
jgi:hypothetical protein